MNELLALRDRVKDLYKEALPGASLEFKFFYTHPQRFLQQADVLLLGINPGGRDGDEPPKRQEETLLRNTQNGYPDQWSAYLHEPWRPGGVEYPAGQAPLQKRIRHLFSLLAGNEPGGEALLRSTPASNLIPVRTNDIEHFHFSALKRAFRKDGHQWIDELIAKTEPRLILTFGMAQEVMRLLGLGVPTPVPAWNGQARIAVRGNSVVFSVPHLSRNCSDKAIKKLFTDLHSDHASAESPLAALRETLASIREKGMTTPGGNT